MRCNFRRRPPCHPHPLMSLRRLGYDGNWSPYVGHLEHERLPKLSMKSQRDHPSGHSIHLRRCVREHCQFGNVGNWARRLCWQYVAFFPCIFPATQPSRSGRLVPHRPSKPQRQSNRSKGGQNTNVGCLLSYSIQCHRRWDFDAPSQIDDFCHGNLRPVIGNSCSPSRSM